MEINLWLKVKDRSPELCCVRSFPSVTLPLSLGQLRGISVEFEIEAVHINSK